MILYRNAIVHILFLQLFYLLWKKVNPLQSRKNSNERTLQNLIVAGLLGIPFDIFGYGFGLWVYHTEMSWQYIFISIATWIASAPIMLAVFNDVEQVLSRFIVKIRLLSFSRISYLILFALGSFTFVVVGFARFLDRDTKAPPLFFFIMLIAGMIAEESLLGILHIKNSFDRVIEGKVLVPFTLIFAGILVGLPWELFNTQFRLWTYDHLPAGKILGIPVFVVCFYGVINLTYVNFIKLTKKYLPALKNSRLTKKIRSV